MPAVCLQGRTGPWRIRSCELSRVSVVLLSCRWASVLSSPCFCPAGGWRSGELDIITPPVQVCSWERVHCGLMHWKSAMAGSACANVFSERNGAAAINHFWQRGQPCWGQQLWAPGLPELCITTVPFPSALTLPSLAVPHSDKVTGSAAGKTYPPPEVDPLPVSDPLLFTASGEANPATTSPEGPGAMRGSTPWPQHSLEHTCGPLGTQPPSHGLHLCPSPWVRQGEEFL